MAEAVVDSGWLRNLSGQLTKELQEKTARNNTTFRSYARRVASGEKIPPSQVLGMLETTKKTIEDFDVEVNRLLTLRSLRERRDSLELEVASLPAVSQECQDAQAAREAAIFEHNAIVTSLETRVSNLLGKAQKLQETKADISRNLRPEDQAELRDIKDTERHLSTRINQQSDEIRDRENLRDTHVTTMTAEMLADFDAETVRLKGQLELQKKRLLELQKGNLETRDELEESGS